VSRCHGAPSHYLRCRRYRDSGASTNTYTCAGDCGGGREILYVTTFDYTGGHDCTSSSGHDVWAEAAGDTVIDLPSYGEFNVAESISNDGADFSTGHYWVCP
jgi:hypothetical protein